MTSELLIVQIYHSKLKKVCILATMYRLNYTVVNKGSFFPCLLIALTHTVNSTAGCVYQEMSD